MVPSFEKKNFWMCVQVLDIAKICIDVDICYGLEAFIMNKVLSLSLSLTF